MTLEEASAHIGHGVIYAPSHGTHESGVIASVGSLYVFVRYGANRTSAATRPEDLFLEATSLLAADEEIAS